MRDPLPEDEDARLAILFQPAAAAVPDDGFTEAVMGRVARRTWRRRLILATAAGAGIVVAAVPAWGLAGALGQEITELSARAAGLGGWLATPWALAAGVLVLVLPGLVGWLEE